MDWKRDVLLYAVVLVAFLIANSGLSIAGGLVSWGSNVCSTSTYVTVRTTYRTHRWGYRDYYSKCGLWGWSRCKRTRSYRIYYQGTRYTSQRQIRYYCCSGWEKSYSGSRHCSSPICHQSCYHGSCSRPNTCSCYSGWRGYYCNTDINECSSYNRGGCQQLCTNTAGSYRCGCNSGYTKTGKRCIDYNECNTSPCKCASLINSCGATCTNTPGSYECRCGKGFELQGKNLCKDVDECSSGSHGCAHTCINSIGTYSCVCRPGFLTSQNGKVCTDIDECQTANGQCEHTCKNTPGSRQCLCNKGYRLTSNNKTCEDIDECSENKPCDHRCKNTAGSFVCSCKDGYKLNHDNVSCSDVNECDSSLHHCEQICSNTEGNYTCGCRPGYKLNSDGRTCQDINECTLGTHQCSHLCINSLGSYQCRCTQGYKLNKDEKSCKALPCTTLYPPSHGEMSCTDMVTNSNCSFSCDHGYNIQGPSKLTCMTTSKWSDSQPSCKAKECGPLKPTSHMILSLPCYRSYGSACDLRCSFGFYSTGNSKVTCDLTRDKHGVKWMNDFQCHPVELCKPNPCQHDGTCVIESSKSFKCNCSDTGYRGRLCQEGVVQVPNFPKLKANRESGSLTVHARPYNELEIRVQSDDYIVPKPRTLKVLHSKPKTSFTLTSKNPGLDIIAYTIQGKSAKDFKNPPVDVLLTVSESVTKNSIFTSQPILPGELPLGCYEVKTSRFSCKAKIFSTLPWDRRTASKQASTKGIVHLMTAKGKRIPLSLLGASTSLSYKKILKNVKTINQYSKYARVTTEGKQQCRNSRLELPQLLELAENDNFARAFAESFTSSIPNWIQLYRKDRSKTFDLNDVYAGVKSENSSCPNILESSNLVTFAPNLGITVSFDHDVTLTDAKGLCFEIDVCSSDVGFGFPRTEVKRLTTASKIFRDMKMAGWTIEPKGFVFSGNGARRNVAVNSRIWHGKNVFYHKVHKYNLAIDGTMKCQLQNNGIKVFLNYEGNAYLNTENISMIDHLGFFQKTTTVFKGKAAVVLKTLISNKNASIRIPMENVIGISSLGGNADDQGLYLKYKGTHNALEGTPFAEILRQDTLQPLFIAIQHKIRGGKHTDITNLSEFNMKMTLLSLLLPQLRNILSNPQVPLLMQKESLQRWTNHINEAETIIKDIRLIIQTGTSEVSNIDLFSRLTLRLKDMVQNFQQLCIIVDSAVNANPAITGTAIIAIQLKQLRLNLPQFPDVQYKRSNVRQHLDGFTLRFQGNVCPAKVCFPSMLIALISRSNHFNSNRGAVVFCETLGEDLQLSKILKLTQKSQMKLYFSSEDSKTFISFNPKISMMGIKMTVLATILNQKLNFQASGLLFGKYEALLNVTGNIEVSDWSHVKYHVRGSMTKHTRFPYQFQRQINTFIGEIASKALARVKNAQNVAREKDNELRLFKKDVMLEVFSAYKKCEKLRKRYDFALKQAKRDYYYFKNTQLSNINQPSQRTCRPKPCPKVCSKTKKCIFQSKRLVIDDTKYVCKNVNTYVERIVVKKRTKTEYYWVKTWQHIYTGNCDIKLPIPPFVIVELVFKAVFGCDHTWETKRGPDKKVSYTKVWLEEVPERIPITKGVCTAVIERRETNSFESPQLTCSDSSCGIKVMDPNCLMENSRCMKRNNILLKNVQKLSEFDKEVVNTFTNLSRLSNKMETARAKLQKANNNLQNAVEELKVAKAELTQLEYAKNRTERAINLVKKSQTTRLGLKLSELLSKTPNQNLVTVSNFVFDVLISEQTNFERVLLRFTISLADGQTKDLSYNFDFGNIITSSHKMMKFVVKTLFQENTNTRRTRRSILESIHENEEQLNKTEGETTLQNQEKCLLVKKVSQFHRDIVKSLEALIYSRENRIERNDTSLMDLLEKFENVSNTMSSNDDSTVELLNSYKNLLRSDVDADDNKPLLSWNQSLIHWRAFFEVLTKESSFEDCASLQDCVITLGSELNELYLYESDFPRANDIRESLSNITEKLTDLIATNLTVGECKLRISELKNLFNQTVDTNVLCGVKPEILSTPEEHQVILENDTIVLECAAESDTPVTYEWVHKNKTIHKSSNGSLTIRNASLNHGGAYQCKASNRKGYVTSNVTTIIINSQPKITQHPNDTKAYISKGNALLLRCNVTGIPFPKIDWFFISIRPNSGKIALPHNNGTFLYNQNLTEDDSGYYFCVASNKHGQAESKIAKVWVLKMTPGEPRFGVKVSFSISQKCRGRKRCPSYRQNDMKDLLSLSMNSSQSQIADMRRTYNQGVTTVRFVYKSSRPDENDKDRPYSEDSILESFARKRAHLAEGVKILYHRIENDSLVSRDDVEVKGDLDSLTVWGVPLGCLRGEEPHSNAYMCVHCPPGTYGKVDGQCEPCPISTYQYKPGQAKCSSCDYGYTTRQVGSLSPEDCIDKRPSPPINLRVIPVGSRQLEVQWDKPAENSKSISHYIVKYGLPNRTPWELVVQTSTTPWILAGLRKFTDYLVQVYAVNSYGKKKSQVTVKTGEDIPDAGPVITNAVPVSHNSIQVSWRPIPKRQRNGIIKGYRIYFSLSSGGEWKSYSTPTGNITTCVVPGLQPYTWYCVKMTGFTSKGEYPGWRKTHCKTLKTPSPPIEVSGEAISDSIIRLKFSTTSGISLSNIVHYGEKPGDLYMAKTCPISACILNNLKADTLYYFKVLGVHKQIGESASLIQVRTKKKAP